MRKIIVTAMTVLAFSLCACGSEKKNDNEINGDVNVNITDEATGVKEDPLGIANANIGDKVVMGTYKDPKGSDVINLEWVIVDKADGVALLAANSMLSNTFMKYSESNFNNWEDSSIRAFLNGEFYENSFTAEEKARIKLTKIDNSYPEELLKKYWPDSQKNPLTHPCADTEDRIFLFSISEIDKYFGPVEEAKNFRGETFYEYSKATTYDMEWASYNYNLRTVVSDNMAMYVDKGGAIGWLHGAEHIAEVRPVMYVTY